MSVTYKISERLLDTSFSDVRAMDNYLGTLLSNCLKLIQTMVGAPHLRADATNVLTADAPDDLASLETAATDLKTQYTAHIATVAQVHVAADVTNAITADDASDLATSITLLNELRTDLVAHAALAAATGHFQADTRTDAITAVACTDLSTAITLYTDLAAFYTAHIGAHYLVSTSDADKLHTPPSS